MDLGVQEPSTGTLLSRWSVTQTRPVRGPAAMPCGLVPTATVAVTLLVCPLITDTHPVRHPVEPGQCLMPNVLLCPDAAAELPAGAALIEAARTCICYSGGCGLTRHG